MSAEFLKMNPKHEVPVFDHNGTFITESREIAKYFHENFNMAPEENDHWYPSDPEERKKVKKLLKKYIKTRRSILGSDGMMTNRMTDN